MAQKFFAFRNFILPFPTSRLGHPFERWSGRQVKPMCQPRSWKWQNKISKKNSFWTSCGLHRLAHLLQRLHYVTINLKLDLFKSRRAPFSFSLTSTGTQQCIVFLANANVLLPFAGYRAPTHRSKLFYGEGWVLGTLQQVSEDSSCAGLAVYP